MSIRDEEAEAVVVGAALQDPALIPDLVPLVQPEMFLFREGYGGIWEAICNVWSRGEPVSISSVAHELAAHDLLEAAGAQAGLRDLKRRAMTVGVEWYAGKIRDAYHARRISNVAYQLSQNVLQEPGNAAELRDEMVSQLLRIDDNSEHERVLTQRYFDDPVELIEYLDDPRQMHGLPSPWRSLNLMLSGWQGGKVYVVQAPTSIGKSLFVQQVAEYSASNGHDVLLCTSEMSNRQVLGFRIAWMRAEVDPQAGVRRGYFSNDERDRVLEAIEHLRGAPLTVTENTNLATIVGHIQRLVSTGECELVIIDHLQHIQSEAPSARERIETAMRTLKEASVRYDVPMLVVSHVNRQALREPVRNASGMHSATIEQDANVVIKLSVQQPDGSVVEDIEAWRQQHGYTPIRCDVEKNREGRTGVVSFRQEWSRGGKYFEVSNER